MKRLSLWLVVVCAAFVPTSDEPVARAQGVTFPTALPTMLPTIPGLPTALPTSLSPGPILAPLTTSMMHSEVRTVIDELIGHLPTTQASRVRGIPLKLDPGPNEINAYAGCDAQGKPFLAGTEGLLQAIFAIAETKACDEINGARSYDTYMAAVLPILTAQTPGSPQLPANVLPAQCVIDPRVLSHARELFDEIAAFTFGHEVAHHYLGHTGCAINDSPFTQGLATVEHLSQALVPAFNQPNELAADTAGLYDVMDTGRARRPHYEYTEKGGMMLLEFFAKLEGQNSNLAIAFSRTHPSSAMREGWVRTAAATWRLLHP
jgi:hypothetical protein